MGALRPRAGRYVKYVITIIISFIIIIISISSSIMIMFVVSCFVTNNFVCYDYVRR